MVKQFVQIGGEDRPVLFSIHALREIEKLVPGYFVLNSKTAGALEGLHAVQVLCYAGLKWGLYKADGVEPKPGFTMLQVGDWIEEEGIQENSPVNKITQLFLDALPKLVKNGTAAQDAAGQKS